MSDVKLFLAYILKKTLINSDMTYALMTCKKA